MRQRPAAAALAFAFLLLQPLLAHASPFSPVSSSLVSSSLDATDDTGYVPANDTLLEKRCANPCGYYGQLCCAVGQTCYTDANNQAQCGNPGAVTTAAAAPGGYWQMYTSTWVETDLITKTSVYSTYIAGTPAATYATQTWYGGSATPGATYAPLTCPASQTACGSICCASGQYCLVSGQCAAVGTTGTASAPLRPTASTLVVQTASLATTTTVPYIAPIPTGASQTAGVTSSQQSSSGLSGGAIAGIVIGVLAAVILLVLLCICLCFREIWHGFLALIGARKKPTTRRETVEYTSYHAGSNRNSRRWYGAGGGDRPARIERSPRRSGGIGGAAKWAAGLGAFAVALGLKRRADRRREEKSDISSSYYSDTFTGTASSKSSSPRLERRATANILSPGSSDRRTRDTQRYSRR